jgi:mandelate racemase
MEKRKPRFQGQMKIKAIRVRAVSAPIKRPLATSVGTVSSAALLLIDLQTDAGVTGRSYLFGIGKHNLAPIAKLVEAMAEMVKGDGLAPLDSRRKLRAKYALLGVHNIVLFAMAGIDMAAWDAWRRRSASRWRAARRRAAADPAYNSNGLGICR